MTTRADLEREREALVRVLKRLRVIGCSKADTDAITASIARLDALLTRDALATATEYGGGVVSKQRVRVYFNSWAGITVLEAELIDVTPTRYRVRWLESGLRRRKGAVGLVPKAAVHPMYGEALP